MATRKKIPLIPSDAAITITAAKTLTVPLDASVSGTNTGDQSLSGYAPLASPTFTGTVTIPTPFTLGAVSVTPTGTELNYVDGVTSAIQTQLNAKKTDSMATDKLLGRGTAGTGVIEEITLGTNLSLTGTTLNASGGAGDMVLASAQTNSGIKTFLDTTMKLRNVANTFDGYFVNTNTADRIYTLKDAAGTLAFTSDITGTNSGTNTGDVTLAGTPDYITITGQVITRALIDLTTHVTGILPSANGGTGVNNAGTLTNATNTTITGGGTLALAGYTLTVPASLTAAGLGIANVFTAAQAINVASTTALKVTNASLVPVVTVDTTNLKLTLGGAEYPGASILTETSSTTSSELITNAVDRNFSGAGNWTGTNWAIAAAALQHTAGSVEPAVLTSTFMTASSIIIGRYYTLTFTISGRTAGSITLKLGGSASLATYSTDGTYAVTIRADADDASISFTPTSTFNGSLDDISLVRLSTPDVVLNNGYHGFGVAAPTQVIDLLGSIKQRDISNTYTALVGFGVGNWQPAYDIQVVSAGAIRFMYGADFDGPTFQSYGGTSAYFAGNVYFDYGSVTRDLATRAMVFRSTALTGGAVTVMTFNASNQIVIGNGRDIVFNTSTGSKLGTATTQKIGFWNATPIVQPAAYTQTYSTASKTMPAATAADLATTAATQTTPWGFAGQAQADAIATQFNLLRADLDATKKVVNQVIDDLQAIGLVG